MPLVRKQTRFHIDAINTSNKLLVRAWSGPSMLNLPKTGDACEVICSYITAVDVTKY